MKKYRILRIIYDFADENVQTEGLSPGPYELSLAQGRLKDHKVYVLTGNLNGTNLKKGKFKYELAGGNVVVYNLPRAVWRFGPFISSSLFVLPFYFYFKLLGKINIVHNHQQMGVYFLLYKFLFGWLDKTPVVHANHGSIKGREEKSLEQGEEFDFMTKYFEYPIWKLNDWLSIKVADRLIAVSVDLVDEMKRFYNPTQPIDIVENSVDTSRFKRDGEKADLQLNKDSIKLLNLGRLSKRKNVDLLVESLKYLPEEYELALIGIWNEKFRNKVDKLIEDNNLNSRVKYLGKISNFEAQKYYRAADIFVLPSSHEGLPKVVIESLASGNKVVASGFDMSKEVPNIYYLDEITSKEIAEKIKFANSRPNKYKETREVIEKYYSWDAKAKDLEVIYNKVLNTKQ